jgi:pimeloyl-ACP methyl ester carboxylesterase
MAYVMHEKKVDTSKIETSFVVLEDGRILEYRIYGETKDFTKTIIEFNGFGATSLSFFNNFNAYYKASKIRGIAITLPGFGYSSVKKNRKIADWHVDVDVILKKEKIEKFWVRGVSFGSCHAMRIAHFYGKQVLGLILIVPLLPNDLITSLNITEYERPPIVLLTDVVGDAIWWLAAGTNILYSNPIYMKFAKDYPDTAKDVEDDFKINLNHLGWKEAMKTLHLNENWGFDIKEINLEKVMIMYGRDDQVAPPKMAEWLVKNIPNAKSHSEVGYGHFTFGIPGLIEKIEKTLFQ